MSRFQLNKKPGMKQFNKAFQEDEEDQEDINASSFTKSKVDDDDDKFKAREEDHDFLDFGHRSVSPSNIFNSLQNKFISPTQTNPIPPSDTSYLSALGPEEFLKNEQKRNSNPYKSPENIKNDRFPIEETPEMESFNKNNKLPSKQSTPQSKTSSVQAAISNKQNTNQPQNSSQVPSPEDQRIIQQLKQPQASSVQQTTPKQQSSQEKMPIKQISNPETPIPPKNSTPQSLAPIDIKWKEPESSAIPSLQTWHTSHYNAQGKVSFYTCPSRPFQKQEQEVSQKIPQEQKLPQKSALRSPKEIIVARTPIKEAEAETPSFDQTVEKNQKQRNQESQFKQERKPSQTIYNQFDRISQKPELLPSQVMASSSQQSTRIEKQRSQSNYENPPPSKYQQKINNSNFESQVLNASEVQNSSRFHELTQKIKFKPNFVRRGQSSKIIKELEKCFSQGVADERINVKKVINQRNLTKDYIIAENPSYYQQSDKQYIDRIFPPNLTMIYQGKFDDHDLIIFKRALNITKRSITLLGVADPNDIFPGELSSNGLIGALCGICEIFPEALTRVFENQSINPSGFYYLRLNVDGVWRYIVVDDFLPVNGEQLLCSGSSQDNRIKKLTRSSAGFASEIWVSLIEKAVSKIYGSYEDLQLANISLKDAYMIVTGAPSEEFPLEQSQNLADFLQMHNTQRNIIQFYGNQCSSTEFQDKLNIPSEFAYTLLGYDCEKQQIKLRNHQGWLKDPQTQKNTILNQEGEFIISVKDASFFFKTINICMYNPGWWSTTIGVNQLPNTFSSFDLEVQEDNDCYITLFQRDLSLFRNNLLKKYEYSFVRIFLFDSDNSLIYSNGGQQKDVKLKAQLKKGNYIIVISIENQNETPTESFLQYYGSVECNIKSLNYLENPNLMAHLLGYECLNQGILLSTQNNIDLFLWVSESLRICSYTWYYKGKTNLKHKAQIKQTPHKSLFEPLCFVNSKEANNIEKLKSSQVSARRKQCWLEANELEIDFPPNSIYSIVFKASDKNQIMNEDFIRMIAAF